MSAYSLAPFAISLPVHFFYTFTYLTMNVFSTKGIHAAYYMQAIYFLHLPLKFGLSAYTNLAIHVFAWLAQVAGHRFFEKNTPAFLDNLTESFLYAPYFTFLETVYPTTFIESSKRYTILTRGYDDTKKTILYFAGLFQRTDKEFRLVADDLPEYNHIFVHFAFKRGDIFRQYIPDIIDDIGNINIECVIGFSFGGAMALTFKDVYREKTGKTVKSILISPGGFNTNRTLENIISWTGRQLYFWFATDKWYMISNYPTYQNWSTLSKEGDYVITSDSDEIHHPHSAAIQDHPNRLNIKHVDHLNMISIIQKQRLIRQILDCINTGSNLTDIRVKTPSSRLNRLLFGGHFYPYHSSLWLGTVLYNGWHFFAAEYPAIYLLYGFLFASTLGSLTEYLFHRFLLHKFIHVHHKKHHTHPNKMSIIHTPMSVVVLNWLVYYFIFRQYFSRPFLLSYSVFFPLNYLAFEITHLLSHSYRGSNNIIQNAKYYHKCHHVTENTNYSFMTPFWDYLFGTLSPKYRVGLDELAFGFIPFYSFFIHDSETNEK